MEQILVIDIGGTRIKSALIKDRQLLKEASAASNGKVSREAILSGLDEVLSVYKDDEFACVGVSSAGRFDPKTGICVYASDNLKGWTGFHLKEYVEQKTGRKAFVENDAVCAMLSLIHDGDPDTVMLTLGSGVGACLYKDGKIYHGNNFDLGELQHLCVKENGLLCDCGKRGCAEKELAAPGLNQLIVDSYGEDIGVRQLFNEFESGCPKAKKVLDEYFRIFDVFYHKLKQAVPSLKTIFISGGIAKNKDVFRNYLSHYPEITLSEDPVHAGLFGAYELALRGIQK